MSEAAQNGHEPRKIPGYVHHIPYPRLPVTAADLSRFQAFLAALITELIHNRVLHPLYLVNPLQIPQDIWREQNRRHAVCWEWESGQAVRITEKSEPETARPSQKFLNTLAKAFPEHLGNLPAIASEPRNTAAEIVHLLRKSEDFQRMFPQRRWFSPLEVFLGSGSCTLYLVQSPDSFFTMGKALTITKANPALGSLDFAVPIFTLEDFSTASYETLQTWFQLFEVYISENQKDNGLLLASRHDLAPVIERVQALLTDDD